MALQRAKSRNLVRLLAVSLAIAMVATVGLVALPAGRAAFTPPGLTVANSKYWGGHTFVPGEVMTITVYATAGDSIDLTIQDVSGSPSSTITGIIVPTAGRRDVNWTVSTVWADGSTYQVTARDTTSGTNAGPVGFTIRQYNYGLFTDRAAYLPGDSVTFNWLVVYEQNYTAAPSGVGAFQVHDSTGANLLSSPQVNFSLSQSSSTFTISTSQSVPQTGTIEFWFNDTAGLRSVHAFAAFRIGTLGITVTGLSPGPYSPGDLVTATIQTRVTGVPGTYPEPDIPVTINVTDLATGNLVPAYGATGLTTDARGVLTYSFVLADTPTTANYELSATGTAHDVQTATSAAGFSVAPAPVLSVRLTLDKIDYMSGDTIHATAAVVTTESLPLTYSWITEDSSGQILAADFGTTSVDYYYTIPDNYQIAAPGYLIIIVEVNDGNGTLAAASAHANVAYGYLNVNLNKVTYSAGDTITASYSLSSNVMTNPTYLMTIVDSTGTTVQSGPVSGGSATYTIPSSPAAYYTFTVVASQGGMSVQGAVTADQVSGYVLSLSLDRSNYLPGDTITISYAITAQGTSALPTRYEFFIALFGVPGQEEMTSSPTGTLTLAVPANAPTGNLLLEVIELNTGASNLQVIHVGAVNPLLTDVAGVPLFDILIFLLFVVLLLAVILLWRRTGMGRAPPSAETGKPTAPPPPPPSGPSQQAAGPMSVACKHCGASIEITTSKRPIEVMCPSCGETQVVQ